MPAHSVPSSNTLNAQDPHRQRDKYSEESLSKLHTWQLRCLIVITALGCVALLGVVFRLLSSISEPLLLFLFSMLLAYIIYPLVRVLRRFMPLPLAIFIVYILLLGLLIVFLYVVGLTAIGQLVTLLGSVQKGLPNLLTGVQKILSSQRLFSISPQQLQGIEQQVLNYLLQLAANVQPFLLSIFGLFIDMILVTTLSVYFVIYGPRFNAWLNAETPMSRRGTIAFFIQTLDRTMGGFIRGQLILGTLMSVIIGIGLFVLGVPYAVLLAAVVFVFEFIPQIGVYISGTIIILIALMTRGWQVGLIVLIFSSFVQGVIDGQILAPRIIGHSVGLNPIISIFALLVGTQLFGLPGAFFSAPIAGAIQTFVIAGYLTWKSNHPEQFIEPDLPVVPAPSPSQQQVAADQSEHNLLQHKPDSTT